MRDRDRRDPPGRVASVPRRRPTRVVFDQATVSVLRHYLVAVMAAMEEAILRTASLQILTLNSSRDFSKAVCAAEGRLPAQAAHAPIRIGVLPWVVRFGAAGVLGPRLTGPGWPLSDHA